MCSRRISIGGQKHLTRTDGCVVHTAASTTTWIMQTMGLFRLARVPKGTENKAVARSSRQASLI